MDRRQLMFIYRAWLLVSRRQHVDFRALALELLLVSEKRFRPTMPGETWEEFTAWGSELAYETFPSSATIEESRARRAQLVKNVRNRDLGHTVPVARIQPLGEPLD